MVPETVQRAFTGHKDEGSDGSLVKLSKPSLGAPLPNYQTPLHKYNISIVTEVDKLTRYKLSGMHALAAAPQHPSHRRELLKLHSVN